LLPAPVKAVGLAVGGTTTVPTGVVVGVTTGTTVVALEYGTTGVTVGLKLTVHGQLVIVIVSEAVAV